MKKQIRTILTTILIAGVLTGSLAGCDNTEKELEEARSKVIPADITAKTLEAVGQLTSYRTDLSVENNQDGEIWTNTETIEFEYPGNMRTLGLGESNYPMVRIGNDEYFSTDGENWHYTESLVDLSLSDSSIAYGIAEILPTLIDMEQLEDEVFDGVDCYHFVAVVDNAAEIQKEIDLVDPDSDNYDETIKSIKSRSQWERKYEVLIGKEDYLLRKIVNTQSMSGIVGEKERTDVISASWTFYDFNEDLNIVAPPDDKILIVELTYDMISSVGGDDIEKQVIQYDVTVGNIGSDTAESLRILIDTEATNSGLRTIEATAEQGKVDLAPDQSVVFSVSWELNMTDLTKEEVSAMLDQSVIRAEWRAGFRSQTVVFE